MHPSEVLQAFSVPGKNNWYTIGYGESRVTVRTQQVRALNLAWALLETGRVRPGDAVAVVGGGAAGLTVAAGLAQKGASVTVLEKERELLPLQRNCHKRHLHPHVFEWPDETADNTRADLPLLNWRAGIARDVALEITEGFRALSARSEKLRALCAVEDIQLDSPHDQSLTYRLALENRRETCNFDAVVFALGFGIEDSFIAGPRGSYWADDSLEQHGVVSKGQYLVSGLGDGSLIDIFRLLLPELTQPEFARLLRVSIKQQANFIEWLRECDTKATGLATKQQQGSFLYSQYQTFDTALFEADALKETIQKQLNERVHVTLLTKEATPFSLRTRPLHRFLFSRLYFDFSAHVGILANMKLSPNELRFDGGRFVYEPNDYYSRTFDHVIVRHGTKTLSAYSAFPELHRKLRGWLPNHIGHESRYPALYFGSPRSSFRGAGGPTLSDYYDELWGRGYMTETIDNTRVPLSRFSSIACELFRQEPDTTDWTVDAASSEDDSKIDKQNTVTQTDDEKALSRKELRRVTQSRQIVRSIGFPLIPSAPHLDFNVPTFIQGQAGTGKTTLTKHLVHTLLKTAPFSTTRAFSLRKLNDPLPLLISRAPDVFYEEQDIGHALTEAALRSAEISNYSTAAVELNELLLGEHLGDRKQALRVFLDGVESWPGETFEIVARWLVANRHELVVLGRRFPKDPQRLGLALKPRVYELLGIAPGHWPDLFRHLGAPSLTPETLSRLRGSPFLAIEWVKAQRSLGREPDSLLETYQTRVEPQIPGPERDELVRLALETLTRDPPRFSFPRASITSSLRRHLSEITVLAGEHNIEFAHLTYGEYLAATEIADDSAKLKEERARLAVSEDGWQHRLEILAMAHAIKLEHLQDCWAELRITTINKDLHHRKFSLLWRALAYGGPNAREFVKQHGNSLLDRLETLLRMPNARFDTQEQIALRYALAALSTDLVFGPFVFNADLTGDPYAAAWAIEALVTHKNPPVPPNSFWWPTIYSEARAMLRSGATALDVVAQTEGAEDSREQALAAEILKHNPIDILVQPSRLPRNIAPDGEPRPQHLHFLSDDEALVRRQGFKCAMGLSLTSTTKSALRQAVLKRETDSIVRARVFAIKDGEVERDSLAEFATLLQPRKTISWSRHQIFSTLLPRFHNNESISEALENFIATGSAWFCDNDDWELLLTHSHFKHALQRRLDKTDLLPHDIRAAGIAKLYEPIRRELRLLVERRQSPFVIAQCIRSLPQGEAESEDLLLTCLRFESVSTDIDDVRGDTDVHAAAARSLAASDRGRSILTQSLSNLDSPPITEAALGVDKFRLSDAGQILSRRILAEKQLDNEWHNCVSQLLEKEEDLTILRALWERLKSIEPRAKVMLDYRRASLLRKLSPTMTSTELVAISSDAQTRVRLAAYESLLNLTLLSSDELNLLRERALTETDHEIKSLLWTHFSSDDNIRTFIKRKARPDLPALRTACFTLLSETSEGLLELRQLLTACLDGRLSARIAQDLIRPLARDNIALPDLRRLIDRPGLEVLLDVLTEDKELRRLVHQKLSDDNWLTRFFLSNALEKYLEDDNEVKALIWKQIQSASCRLSPDASIAILGKYGPAQEWGIKQAVSLGEDDDLNAFREARRLWHDDPEVRLCIERTLSSPASQRELDLTIHALEDVQWALPLLAAFEHSDDKTARTAGIRAALRLRKIPRLLRSVTDVGKLDSDLQNRETEPRLRREIVQQAFQLPVSPEERDRWLTEISIRDHDSQVRSAARKSLAGAGPSTAIRDSIADFDEDLTLWDGEGEIAEDVAPDRFARALTWVLLKLVSSLPDTIVDVAHAIAYVDAVNTCFGDDLGATGGCHMLRIAKDVVELPRDRRIWPSSNVVLAWERASRLVAKSPLSVVLACADLEEAPLRSALPSLEEGEMSLGPVFFGFRIRNIVA